MIERILSPVNSSLCLFLVVFNILFIKPAPVVAMCSLLWFLRAKLSYVFLESLRAQILSLSEWVDFSMRTCLACFRSCAWHTWKLPVGYLWIVHPALTVWFDKSRLVLHTLRSNFKIVRLVSVYTLVLSLGLGYYLCWLARDSSHRSRAANSQVNNDVFLLGSFSGINIELVLACLFLLRNLFIKDFIQAD